MKRILMLMLCVHFVFADAGLTLDQAKVYARKHSSKYTIINREYEIARGQAFQGYGAVLPSFEARYSDMVRKSPVAAAPDLPPTYSFMSSMFSSNDETKVKTTELSGSWMIFSFAGFAAVGAANNAFQLADQQYADNQQAFDLDLTKAFYDLQTAIKLKQLTEKTALQASKHAQEVEAMYKNSLVSRKDYLDAQVRRLSAKQEAYNGSIAYISALRVFNVLVGLPVTANPQLETGSMQLQELPPQNIDELFVYAQQYKPAYQASATLVRLSEADEWGAWGESLPQVFLSYSKQNNKYDQESSYAINGDTETKMWFASWKFFSGGGANFHKFNEKKNAKEKMYALNKQVREYLRLQIETALKSVEVKYTNYLMALEQDKYADEALKIAEINFREGAGTSTDYNDTLVQKLASEMTRIKAEADYVYACAQLNYAVGKEVVQ